MNVFRLVPCLCLLLAACGQKPSSTQAPSPAAGTPPAAATPPAAQSTPVPDVLPATGTPEQIGSTLRLRIAHGGLPARDTVAALLHRDEIVDPALTQGKGRFALALLKGWNEGQLRDNEARLILYRNKVNVRGDTEAVPFPATLVQFDPTTGLGIVAYVDTFVYASDVGFRLERTGDPTHTNLPLLGSRPGPGDGTASTARYQRQGDAGRFSVVQGVFHGAGEQPARVEWAMSDSQGPADPVALVVSAPDKLMGFVETAPDGPILTGLKDFSPRIKFPSYEVTRISFEDPHTSGRFEIVLAVQSGSGDPVPRQLRMRFRQQETTAQENARPADNAGPIAPEAIDLQSYTASTPSWRCALPAPAEGQDTVYLLQLSWPLLPGKDALEVYGRPFRVRVEHRPGGLFPTVLDPPRNDDAQRTAATAPTAPGGNDPARFSLEAAVLDVHLVEGGREALLHLDRAPHWKRFSFEKNDWQPLPETTANQTLTGNLNALFVLDQGLHVVRKYRLPNLEPAGDATIPSGEYIAILAGCNSEHAPVHLMRADGLLSLDADSLQPRDIPLRPDQPGGAGFNFYASSEPDRFFTTGDGLAVARLSGGTGQIVYRNDDLRGFERSYLGVGTGGFCDEVPGVSAGWSAGDGARCRDVPGGGAVNPVKPMGSWQYARGALAENAPVVFRLLRPNTNELPPRMRLGCFAAFGAVPFAEVDAPELAGLPERGLWWRDRWVFLDPYSRRLATLSTDRHTWSVRRLESAGGNADPALLNWPDTVLPRGSTWTFHPVLTKDSQVAASILGKTPGPTVEAATGTVSLPVASDSFDSLQLLNIQLAGQDAAASKYPILLHTDGLEMPYAIAPGTETRERSRPEVDPTPLGINGKDFLPFKATLYRFPEAVKTIVGPVAGCMALVTASGRVDFLSVETRQTVGSFTGSPDATYYAGPGALLQYEPAQRTLARISVPAARREQTLTLPSNVALRGIGSGTDRTSPLALDVEITARDGNTAIADLVLKKKPPSAGTLRLDTVAVLDGATFKAGTRAQPVPLSYLSGKPDVFRDGFAGSGNPDKPPVSIPASRDGSVFALTRHFLVVGTSYAVAYPYSKVGSSLDFTSTRGDLGGSSLTGLMAFGVNGKAYKAGTEITNSTVAGSQSLGSTADGRYIFYLLNGTISGETKVEVCAAEDNQPLLQLRRVGFAEQLPSIGGDRFTRRIWSLGDHGPIAVLSAGGLAMELMDLDIPAVARQIAPKGFHVVSQPLPYVMEGRVSQYPVRVNNPAAVQSVQLQNPTLGVVMSADGTVSITGSTSMTGPTYLHVAVEIKGKNGRTILHEFPVCVLPTPRAGVSMKTGELWAGD